MADKDQMAERRGIGVHLDPVADETAPLHRRLATGIKGTTLLTVGVAGGVVAALAGGGAAIHEIAANGHIIGEVVPYVGTAAGGALVTAIGVGGTRAKTGTYPKDIDMSYRRQFHKYEEPKSSAEYHSMIRRVAGRSAATVAACAGTAVAVRYTGVPLHTLVEQIGIFGGAAAGGVAGVSAISARRSRGYTGGHQAIGE